MPQSDSTSHRCPTCSKAFARAEHCARHQLTHTSHRPFCCPRCDRRFQRLDSLRRHFNRYCQRAQPDQGLQPSPDQELLASLRRQSRTRRACDACCSRKTKCSGAWPCSSCTFRNQTCTYQSLERNSRAGPSPAGDAEALVRNYVEDSPALPRGLLSEPIIACRSPPAEPARSAVDAPTGIPNLTQGQALRDGVTIRPSDELHQPVDMASWNFSHDVSLDAMPDAAFFELDDLFLSPSEFELSGQGLGIWADTIGLSEGMASLLPKFDPISVSMENFRQAVSATSSEPVHFDSRIDRFLKRSLVSRTYDATLVDTLLAIFRVHVWPTFQSFAKLPLTEKVLPQQVLAMAAVGAVFCDLPGSTSVAKALYAESHRMFCHSLSAADSMTEAQEQSHFQTLLSLEIYGMCSGHDRAHEISEGYHHSLHQTFASLTRAAVNPVNPSVGLLLDDLLLIESYRMAFLQQPPHVSQLTLLAAHSEQAVLTTGNGNGLETIPDLPSWRDIGLCANYSWLSSGVYDVQTYEAQNRRWGLAAAAAILESLAERFRREGGFSQSLLCLTLITSLCAPISCIQDHFDSVTSSELVEDETPPIPDTIRIWQQSNDCVTALKFALSALQMIEEMVIGKNDGMVESPHDANCVFLCTIVACAATSTSLSSQERTGPGTIKIIDIAIGYISHLHVGVARAMKHVLVRFRERSSHTTH